MVLLEMKDCAEKLGVSQTTFWRMRKDFPIKTYRLGGRQLVEEEDLFAWFKSEERNALVRSAQ